MSSSSVAILTMIKYIVAFNAIIVGTIGIGSGALYFMKGSEGIHNARKEARKFKISPHIEPNSMMSHMMSQIIGVTGNKLSLNDLQKEDILHDDWNLPLEKRQLNNNTSTSSPSSTNPEVSSDDDDDDGKTTVIIMTTSRTDPSCIDEPEPGHECVDANRKSDLTAFLLTFFLGVFGAGYFYLKLTGAGVGSCLTCGGCGIWALIAWILILTGDIGHDGYGCCLLDKI